MTISMRAFAAAAVLLVTAAHADVVNGSGYSAVFPCTAKHSTQQVSAGAQTIPVASANCQDGNTLFSVVTSRYPKGFIAKKTLAGAFNDAVAGAAANVKGTVRSDKPIKLGAVAGHDALIDASNGLAVHLRVFFVGDTQYQVMAAGPKGSESAKPAMDFLGSFKLGK